MTETRQFESDLEIRAQGDGRTIVGLAVPYNKEQRINSQLTEVFRPGAFQAVTRAAHRVKLLVGHDHQALPIGRATLLREDANGLYSEFYVSKTERGDSILELVRDGALDQLSIGFLSLKDNRLASGVIERIKAHLAEVSLVTFGAYGDAANIVAVRQEIEKPNLASIEAIVAKVRK